LKEACDAIIDTSKAMQKAHREMFNPSHFHDLAPHPAIPATEKDLDYMLGAFNSSGLRIRSVETRVKNVINLVGIVFIVLNNQSLYLQGIQSGDPER
jgi:hypothetical protein